MISEWVYYGFLTLLVEGILYVGYLLARDYWKSYVRNKIRKDNPHMEEVFNIIDEVGNAEAGQVPLITYLVYPTDKNLTTENSAVYVTRARALLAAEDNDIVIQVMSFPPDTSEKHYLSSPKGREEIITALFDLMVEEDSDSEE